MADATKRRSIITVKEEATKGTYVDAVVSDAIETEIGGGIDPDREIFTRNVIRNTLGNTGTRVGMKAVAGSLPVEFRASNTLGNAPEFDLLLKSAALHNVKDSEDITSEAAGNGDKTLEFSSTDVAKLKVGDIIVVKQSANWISTPITGISGTTVTTLRAPKVSGADVDFEDSVEVSIARNYTPTIDTEPKTFSVSRIYNKASRLYGYGCYVNSMVFENLTPSGGLPKLTFGFEGFAAGKNTNALTGNPTYVTSEPPIPLGVTVLQDGVELLVNTVELSIENTINYKEVINSEDGKIGINIVQRNITGTLSPYLDDASVAQWEKFNSDTPFSVFISAANKTSAAGEFAESVSIWLPRVKTGYALGEDEELYLENLNFTAETTTPNVLEDIVLGFY